METTGWKSVHHKPKVANKVFKKPSAASAKQIIDIGKTAGKNLKDAGLQHDGSQSVDSEVGKDKSQGGMGSEVDGVDNHGDDQVGASQSSNATTLRIGGQSPLKEDLDSEDEWHHHGPCMAGSQNR